MADPSVLAALLKSEGQGGIGSDARMPMADQVRLAALLREEDLLKMNGSRVPSFNERGEPVPGPAAVSGDKYGQPQWPMVDPRKAVGSAVEGMASGVGGNAPGAIRAGLSHLLAKIPKPVAAGAPIAGAALAGASEANPADKVDPAQAQDMMRRLVASDPTLQAMDKQIRDAEVIARANPGTGPGQQTLKNRQMANDQLPGLRDKFNARVAELTKGSLPFDKANPTLAQWWPAIQWGGPVVAAMATKFGLNSLDRAMTGPWRQAVAEAEKAFKNGDGRLFDYHAGKAAEFLKEEPGKVMSFLRDIMRDTVAPAAAGIGVGMEASLYPHQYNRTNAPVGSKEREDAEKKLGEQFWDTAKPGIFAGSLGGFTGAHLPNRAPGYRPVAESRNLAGMLKSGEVVAPGIVVSEPLALRSAQTPEPLAPRSAQTSSLPAEPSAARPRLAERIGQSPLAGMLRSQPLPAVASTSTAFSRKDFQST